MQVHGFYVRARNYRSVINLFFCIGGEINSWYKMIGWLETYSAAKIEVLCRCVQIPRAHNLSLLIHVGYFVF